MHSLLVHVEVVFLSLYVCIYLKMIVHTIFLIWQWLNGRWQASIHTSKCVCVCVCSFTPIWFCFFFFSFYLLRRESLPFSSLCSFGSSDDDQHYHQWLIVKFVLCVLFLLLSLSFFISFYILSKTARDAPLWTFEYMLMVLRASSVIWPEQPRYMILSLH
jgi:hypothetical protein